MSAAAIPYHLRSHKAVDRRLFVDLLMRFERWRPLLDSVYISMGAYPLEDHRIIHRLLGITKLLAFDYDGEVVSRQIFNRPINTCRCVQKTSGELVSELDRTLAECDLSDFSSLIIWLDYTDPKLIGEQIREFQELIEKLAAGDFVRITINANPRHQPRPDGAPVLISTAMENQLGDLKLLIGEYLSSTVTAGDMCAKSLPKVLAEAFGAAALKALPVSGDLTFLPLSIVRYADTTQMLSISGTVVKRSDEEKLRESLDLQSWPFASKSWSDVRELVVPTLTLRERLFLERGIWDKSDDQVINALGFSSAGGIEIRAFLENYKKYYRFYPTMLPAEI